MLLGLETNLVTFLTVKNGFRLCPISSKLEREAETDTETLTHTMYFNVNNYHKLSWNKKKLSLRHLYFHQLLFSNYKTKQCFFRA